MVAEQLADVRRRMAEAAERHFTKRAYLNTLKPEKMAAHPCSADVRNSGREYTDLSRRDHAIAFNAHAKGIAWTNG